MPGSIFTRKFPNALLVVAVVSSFAWWLFGPASWASDMARAQVETCYTIDFDGWAEGCISIKQDLKDAESAYGAVKSRQIVSVSRGLSNRNYTVKVEVDRERAKTTEEFQVSAFYSNTKEARISTTNSLEVHPR